MNLRKIFQGYVGFALVGAAFFTLYTAAAFFHDPSRSMNFEPTGRPILPRLAYSLGLGIPVLAATLFWKERRPAAVGAMAFGLVALIYWLLTGG